MSAEHPETETEAPGRLGVFARLMRGWRAAVIPALYALLTVGMTWPSVPRLATDLPGQGQDLWVHWWNFWWLGESLLQGQSPFFTDLLFHPWGVSLVYHSFAWARFFSRLPLRAVIGFTAALGVVVLLMFALSGYTRPFDSSLERDTLFLPVTGFGEPRFRTSVGIALGPGCRASGGDS